MFLGDARKGSIFCYNQCVKTTILSLQDLEQFADSFVIALVPREWATVVALHGELGAGKTTLSQMIAKRLGIEEIVQSPTFVIMKSYPITKDPRFTRLVHLDLYRIESQTELEVLKFSELLADPSALVLVEWAERAGALMPRDALDVSIEMRAGENGEMIREITYVRQFKA